MGNYPDMQLRESSLQTKLLLNDETSIIEHLSSENIQLNEPINRMGDTLLHYAAYSSLKQVLLFAFQNRGDIFIENHRGQRPIDVANPETREWMWRMEQSRRKKIQQEEQERKHKKTTEVHADPQLQQKKKNQNIQFLAKILMGK